MSTTLTKPKLDLDEVNRQLESAGADDIVRWAAGQFGGGLIMTSSFGAQSAVMLHLVTQILPDIPVTVVDTGYFFPETYQFIDELTRKLRLNLKVYQATLSPAWMEAVHGKLWEKGEEGIVQYNDLRKVEPMARALQDLKATAWLAGLRRGQTDHRNTLRLVELQDGIYKVHPILKWSGKEVHEYIKKHGLSYHPLYDKGYPSIGDWHSTLPVTAGQHERSGRFMGLKQECGLHVPKSREENQSRESSAL